MNLDECRRRIDELDREIVRLVEERAECALQVWEHKRRENQSVYAPERERQVLERVAANGRGVLPASAIQSIYREIISACRGLERALTVAYWGPPASNTHVAARRHFGAQVEFLETSSVASVFSAVERGEADFGVIPVENSTEGVVAYALDPFIQSELSVCAELFLPIHHNLLSRADSLEGLRRVYTMFQATAQCREWINRHLQHVELVETTTTARGAELASQDPEAGAIANAAAADLYGLNVVSAQIEDNPRNRTRFWVIGKIQSTPSGRDKTSVLFSVAHRPGGLVHALEPFSRHGVSLTFIESRPTKLTPWEYVFFVDVVGHMGEGTESPLALALEELREHCLYVRVLGSYPETE